MYSVLFGDFIPIFWEMPFWMWMFLPKEMFFECPPSRKHLHWPPTSDPMSHSGHSRRERSNGAQLSPSLPPQTHRGLTVRPLWPRLESALRLYVRTWFSSLFFCQCRLHLMPEGKHNLHLRFPEEFNKVVEDFLGAEPKERGSTPNL